jgi:lipoyl(octanoyl) transferase
LVGYPILDLDNFFTDIHRYLRCLEEAVILMLSDYGIQAGRVDGMTGVWIGQGREARKICAMGVRTSRWVTMHGFALNVNTELDYFNYIIPCGIQDKAVTSMKKELGKDIPMSDVEQKLLSKLAAVFEMKIIKMDRGKA